MFSHGNYIMRDQIQDSVSSIMKYDVTKKSDHIHIGYYLLSASAVIFVYLLAMAVTAG